MGLVVRQSITTTLISYAGVVIGYINLLYLYPRFLAPEQVGLFRTLQDAAILFTPFAQFGIAQSIQRYYPQFGKDQRQAGAFISMMLVVSLVGFALFFIVFSIFKGNIAAYFEVNAHDFIQYISLTAWLTLILLLTAVLEAYSRALLQAVIPSLLRELVIRLLLAVLILVYFMGYLTFDQFIASTLGAYLICLVILILFLWRNGDLQLTSKLPSFGKSLSNEMFRYSLFGFAGTAGMIIIGKMDSLMVSGMMGLAANAVYTTSFYMATVIEIPKRAMSQVAMPLFSRAFEKDDMADIRTLYHKTALNQFIIGALLLIGVAANLNNLFELMPRSSVYSTGYAVVLIVGCAKLVDMLFGPSSEIIVLSRYYWFNLILIVLLAVMTIALNNLLIPIYGLVGAAYGAALSLILFNIAKFIFLWARMGLQPFTFSFIKVAAVGAVAWAVHLLVPRMDGVILDMVVRSGCITLAFSLLILWLRVSPEANGLVKGVIGRVVGNR